MNATHASTDDLFAPSIDASTPPDLGYVLCEFAGLTLAIPQTDVVTIEHGSALSAPMPGEAAAGWFDSAQGPWPVYAFDAQLRLMPDAPRSRSFLVFVKSSPWPAGLLCESVRIMSGQDDLALQPLPAPMQDYGPVDRIARLGPERLALACYPGAMAVHLERCMMQGLRDE